MPKFNQEHYDIITNHIKGDVNISNVEVRLTLYNLCDLFKKDNPQFDKNQFLLNCGFRARYFTIPADPIN
jgi:hypothetical protein